MNKRLEGKLKVVVVPEADRTPLKNFLLSCHLEGVGEKRLAWIEEMEAVSPLALAQAIGEGAASLQVDWGLTSLVADALIKLQPSQLMELEALELDHRVDIELNVSHNRASIPPSEQALHGATMHRNPAYVAAGKRRSADHGSARGQSG